MSDRAEISREIRNLTQLLVEKSISVSQNYPRVLNNTITWSNFQNLAFTLQDEPYETIYKSCRKAKDYNFMLIDGALIQMQYKFNRNNLVSHILRFYPNPNFENYQDNPEEYEELYFGIELFTDMINKKAIVFPLRFDFSNVHNEMLHPMVHATFGNYKDCRIPISKPISPNRFMSFILRNFYFFKFIEENLHDEISLNLSFGEQVTNNEKKLLHFTYE
ncbi:MAG: DUF2290 domain-containing protein [Candidatus Heimdallarchaeota archaeon]|nr:DUF2290 domain-containing protein [Candidatus Heimdallarchaeota archaeon]